MSIKVSDPCIITPRLLPGIRIGNSFVSIEYGDYNAEGRMQYVTYIDAPGLEVVIDDHYSGIGNESLVDGLSGFCSFALACAESVEYQERTGKAGEHVDLFAPNVRAWIMENKDQIELAYLHLELAPIELGDKEAIQEN